VTGPVPARVDAPVKDVLLGLVDHAVGQGWSLGKACQVLDLDTRRVHRWIGRRHRADLADHRPGVSVNALLADEVTAIVEVFNTWGERDRPHRRLAHRGSYLGRFWASPSTVRRVLTLQDKHFRPLPHPAKGARRPFPDWASYRPNSIWIYDSTHFTRCGMTVLIIEDLASRVPGRPRRAKPFPVDEFGLVEPVDGLGQGVVIAVRDGPDGGLQAGLDEPVGVPDRGVLTGFNRWKQHRLVLVTVGAR